MKLNPVSFIYILTSIVVLIVVYFALKRIGLIKPLFASKLDKEKQKVEIDQAKLLRDEWNKYSDFKNSKLFDPNYINGIAFSDRGIFETDAIKLAKQIKNSFGFFNDNEDSIYDAFRSIKKKSDVSMIARSYNNLFGSDLRSDLLDNLNESEIRNLWTIINEAR